MQADCVLEKAQSKLLRTHFLRACALHHEIRAQQPIRKPNEAVISRIR